MTTTDTLLADLADVLDRASKLAKDLSTTLAGPSVDMLAAPVDPLREFRLPSGRVAYTEEAARWVHVGDWIQAVHGDEGRWEQVVGTVRADMQTCITSTDGTRTQGRWWGHDDKVKVATAPVPDPEPYR